MSRFYANRVDHLIDGLDRFDGWVEGGGSQVADVATGRKERDSFPPRYRKYVADTGRGPPVAAYKTIWKKSLRSPVLNEKHQAKWYAKNTNMLIRRREGIERECAKLRRALSTEKRLTERSYMQLRLMFRLLQRLASNSKSRTERARILRKKKNISSHLKSILNRLGDITDSDPQTTRQDRLESQLSVAGIGVVGKEKDEKETRGTDSSIVDAGCKTYKTTTGNTKEEENMRHEKSKASAVPPLVRVAVKNFQDNDRAKSSDSPKDMLMYDFVELSDGGDSSRECASIDAAERFSNFVGTHTDGPVTSLVTRLVDVSDEDRSSSASGKVGAHAISIQSPVEEGSERFDAKMSTSDWCPSIYFTNAVRHSRFGERALKKMHDHWVRVHCRHAAKAAEAARMLCCHLELNMTTFSATCIAKIASDRARDFAMSAEDVADHCGMRDDVFAGNDDDMTPLAISTAPEESRAQREMAATSADGECPDVEDMSDDARDMAFVMAPSDAATAAEKSRPTHELKKKKRVATVDIDDETTDSIFGEMTSALEDIGIEKEDDPTDALRPSRDVGSQIVSKATEFRMSHPDAMVGNGTLGLMTKKLKKKPLVTAIPESSNEEGL